MVTVTSTTSTSTTTTSTTTNVVFATATVYATCAENNLADTVDGQQIGETINSNGVDKFHTVNGIDSAYDCKSCYLMTLDEHRPTDARLSRLCGGFATHQPFHVQLHSQRHVRGLLYLHGADVPESGRGYLCGL